jgi:hypothetical protein
MSLSLTPLQDPDCDDSALQSVDHKLFEEVIWPKLYEMVPAFEELKVTASWAGFYDYNTLDQVLHSTLFLISYLRVVNKMFLMWCVALPLL